MGDLKLLKDSSTIVGDCDIADVVNKHLVEALRTQRSFHDV